MTTHSWPDDVRTLAIDIGGSGFKAAVLDTAGTMLTERVRMEGALQESEMMYRMLF